MKRLENITDWIFSEEFETLFFKLANWFQQDAACNGFIIDAYKNGVLHHIQVNRDLKMYILD